MNLFKFNKLNSIKVFINGNWIGYTSKPEELILQFKTKRRECKIHPHTSIYWNIGDFSIFIFSDGGMCIRPLIQIENAKNVEYNKIKNLNWAEMFLPNSGQLLEYIDVCEVNNCLIQMKYKNAKMKDYTHSEIDPCLILGALASCIPFKKPASNVLSSC